MPIKLAREWCRTCPLSDIYIFSIFPKLRTPSCIRWNTTKDSGTRRTLGLTNKPKSRARIAARAKEGVRIVGFEERYDVEEEEEEERRRGGEVFTYYE